MTTHAGGQGDDKLQAVDGDVRFGTSGSLEIFDGTDWVPLRRSSDVGPPIVFRSIPPELDEDDS
ncbi:MAG TPA: hypothetical protein VMA72_08785 [Streptosporangiaceae bacterium]|nr:hypothetical protein [Streptosporangiaceae bacterium]